MACLHGKYYQGSYVNTLTKAKRGLLFLSKFTIHAEVVSLTITVHILLPQTKIPLASPSSCRRLPSSSGTHPFRVHRIFFQLSAQKAYLFTEMKGKLDFEMYVHAVDQCTRPI